jgi:allantoinase
VAAEAWDLVLAADRAVVGREERPVRIGIKDGRIATLDADATPDVTLASDEVLLPGLVDTHVHVNEPGRTDWEGYASATRAAAAGGVTTLLDMPLNSIPPTTTVANLRTKQDVARDQVWIDTGFWGGAVPGNASDLPALHQAGVFGFKCFLLPSGVEEFPPLDADGLAEAMQVLAPLDGLLIAHAEDEHEITDPAGPAYDDFLASRPPAAEQRAIDLVIGTAQRTGARAHVVHLATGDALPAIRAARAEGVRLTIETCPHYLTFTAEEIPDGHTEFKCCPPIRDDANRAELWQALADGDIDLVVSDHSPCTADLKVPDFREAWGGIASVQLSLPAVWTGARERGHSLVDVVGWMATGPADLVGLDDRGRIAVGATADFAVLAPEESFVVDPARLWHKNPVTAYAGRSLVGTVRQTWLHGRPLDLSAPPRGRLIERPR